MNVYEPDERLLESLRHNCAGPILDALTDPEVIEIMLNPDGRVWIERYGQGQVCAGELPPGKGGLILSLVASSRGLVLTGDTPILDAEFPLDGSRFAGVIPPVVGPGPSFSMRKKASKVFTLDEYVASGAMRREGADIITAAVRDYRNIVVVGGTSSGKTTLVNGIIDCIFENCPEDRLLILEDTTELQSRSPNTVQMHTHIIDEDHEIGLRTLAKLCMRYAPKRIIVGEVRDYAALELLKLWNTGHPGGVGTFHADSAEESLERLEELVEEAGLGPKQKLIGRAVDLVVYMQKHFGRRRVSHMIRVKRFNPQTLSYETETLYEAD